MTLDLTERQAMLLLVHADIEHRKALKMAQYLAIPPFTNLARSYYDEAADWVNIGRAVEEAHPEAEKVDWKL